MSKALGIKAVSSNIEKTAIDWLDILQKTELRALASVSNEITQLISDKNTSVSALAAMILKDASLTSQVLKIASSVSYKRDALSNGDKATRQVSQDSELRQAIVRIGFNGIRCICISIALIDSISKKPEKKQRLFQCLVSGFHTAIHARNVAEKLGQCRCEDVFIAGLLQNIGELVFWTSPIPETEGYKDALIKADGLESDAAQLVTGMNFQDMSKGLAEAWSLSATLSDSFDPGVLNKEVKAINLGIMMSQGIEDGWDSGLLKMALTKITSDLSMDLKSAMLMLEHGAEETSLMAKEYGPGDDIQIAPSTKQELDCVTAIPFVDDIMGDGETDTTSANDEPIRVAKNKLHQASANNEGEQEKPREPDASKQVELFDKLWDTTDQDEIFTLLVEGVFNTVGLERVALFKHDEKREELRLSQWAGTNIPDSWSKDVMVSVASNKDSVFRLGTKSHAPLWVSKERSKNFDDLISDDVSLLMGETNAMVLSVIRNGLRVVAVVYADMGDTDFAISDSHFSGFSRLSKQVSSALTMA